MCRDQIEQQEGPDKMPPWKNRYFQTVAGGRPPDEEALKVARLHLMDAKIHLCESAYKDQHQRRRETDNRQLER